MITAAFPPRIDRYTIKRTIGDGAFGTVFLAHDPRLHVDVAIKLLTQRDAATIARFDREGMIMAQLRTVPVVTILDCGTYTDAHTGETVPYIVLTYMKGGDLHTRIQAAHVPFTPFELRPLVQRMAHALDTAHNLGVIHQDIKPANIVYDQHDKPYLTDFGIAQLAGERVARMGTAPYMAPEQWEQNTHLLITPATDVYQLGVTFFQALTGRLPFETLETEQAQRTAAFRQLHLTQRVPRITDRQRTLPTMFNAFFQKALAKEPRERFATVGEMAAMYQAILDKLVQQAGRRGGQKR